MAQGFSSYAAPSNLTTLPAEITRAPATEGKSDAEEETDRDDDGHCERSVSPLPQYDDRNETNEQPDRDPGTRKKKFPRCDLHATRCGTLPDGVNASGVLAWPEPRPGRRVSRADMYLETYAERLQEATAPLHPPHPLLVTGTDSTCHVSVADVLESHNAQLQFLKDVDNYRADGDEAPTRSVLQQQKGIAPKGPRFPFASAHFLFVAGGSRPPALASSTLYRPSDDFPFVAEYRSGRIA